MPYEIKHDTAACAAYGVFKQDGGALVPGGCHDTLAEAQDHLAALHIATEGERAAADEERAPINPDGYETTGAMREEAARGLEWRREFGRGGTAVGVARARDIMNGKRLPFDTVMRMVSFFARHENDAQAQGFNPGEDGYPSAGRIAHALWGGTPGKRWANSISDNTERQKENTKMAIEHRQAKTEIRALEDGHTFEGYAALFDTESDGLGFREVIRSGAFAKSVAAAKRGEWEVKALQDHRGELFLGSTRTGSLSLEEDDRGLKVRIALNPEVSFASDLAAMLKRDGAAMGMSFGFSVPAKGDRYAENGALRELTNVRLHEVSVLTGNEPAYPATIGMGAVRHLSLRSGVEPERLTRAIDSLLYGEVDEESADTIDRAIRRVAPEVRSPWVAAGDESLPVDETREWDGAAAAERVFTLAKFDSDNPNTALAARAFLVHDAGAPELRGSYKLGFADVVDDTLVAIRAGLNAAASRLEQTDIPAAAMDAAREILDEYAPDDESEDMTEDAARTVPLSVYQRQLELARMKL